MKQFTLPQTDGVHENKMLREMGDVEHIGNSFQKMVIEPS